ncbi:MAG: S9 family peptidase, partial [Pseudomonadales bacterium]|nr:S9 family peptidase [Pseudomonadales bacterium]
MIAAYGAWPSPVDAELVASGSRGYAELRGQDDALFWLESRPDQAGRSTLTHWHEGVSRELIPAPFNARSRVHEYGGGAFCVADGRVYFVNFADQNIYGIRFDGDEVDAPWQVTEGDATERFADLVWEGTAIFAVRERH